MAFKRATKIQSIMFDKKKWTVTKAKQWLRDHKHKVPTVDTTSEYHRFRQEPPFAFEKGTFRTIVLGAVSRGIKAVVAVPKKKAVKSNAPKRKPKSVKSPRIPSLLVDIADAISVDIEGGKQLKFKRSDKYSLCASRSGSELWIVSRKNAKSVKATDDKGEKLYELFTGFEHNDVGKMVHVFPKKMVRIGRAINVVYRSDKFSQAGKMSDYIHAFQRYPTITVDNVQRPTVIALRGGNIRITKEGIRG
jgi:hypothetical protein